MIVRTVRWLFPASTIRCFAPSAVSVRGALAQHHVEPHVQLAPLSHLLVEIHRLEPDAGVGHRDDAFRDVFAVGHLDFANGVGFHLLGGALRAVRGEGPADEAGRALAEHADRVAGAVLEDLSAGRALRLPRDAGQRHGLRVGDGRVPAGMGQEDRVVRRRLAQELLRREALDRTGRHAVPLLLVPTAAENPLPWLLLLGRLRHHRDDLVPVARLHQFEVQLGLADAHEVGMALGERRHCESARQVNQFRLLPDVGLDLGHRPDRLHLPVPHGDGFGRRLRRIDRCDMAVRQHKVGRFDPGPATRRARQEECGRNDEPCLQTRGAAHEHLLARRREAPVTRRL